MGGKISLPDHLPSPSDLGEIGPFKPPFILPDLSIAAKAETCRKVSFTVNYFPGSFKHSGNPGVKVRVIDKIFGVPTIVGEALVFVPGEGGSTSATIEWPMPADGNFNSFTNEFTVVVDPDNTQLEAFRKNNSMTVTGTCVG